MLGKLGNLTDHVGSVSAGGVGGAMGEFGGSWWLQGGGDVAHPRMPIQSGDLPVQGAAAASGHLADEAGACIEQGEGPVGSLGWGGVMAPCRAARGSARSTGRHTPRPAAAPAASPSGAGCRTKHGPPEDIEPCLFPSLPRD